MIRKLILPLILVIAVAMNAQVSFGVHAGLGITTVTTPKVLKDNDITLKNKVGPIIGITSTIEICDFMSLQPELNVSWRGYKDNVVVADGPIGSDVNVTCKINSIYGEIPLMFKFYPSTSCGFNLQIGPQLGVLFSRKLSVSNKNLDIEGMVQNDNRDVDFGFNFGAGYSFYNWDIDLRYYVGLVKTYTSLDHYQNRGVQVILGYNF